MSKNHLTVTVLDKQLSTLLTIISNNPGSLRRSVMGAQIYNDDKQDAMSICQSDEELISWVWEGRKCET